MAWPRFLSLTQSRRTWGLLLLGVWLIMTGLQKLGTLHFGEIDKVLGGIAIAAGALIIMDR